MTSYFVSPVPAPPNPYAKYARGYGAPQYATPYSNLNSAFAKEPSETKLERSPAVDTVAFKGVPDTERTQRTTEEKQAIIKKARNKAAAASIIFMGGSTAYYALRSDEKIAKKYNLDPNGDKELIDTVRKTQVKWTIPSLLGLGVFGWLGSLIMNKKNINV